MSTSRLQELKALNAALVAHEAQHGGLAGVTTTDRRTSFLHQVVDSVRRVEYVKRLSSLKLDDGRHDPGSDLFDPIRGAIALKRKGAIDEAFWLVFLATHCGKSGSTGWRLARDIYGGEGPERRWTWPRVSGDVAGFRTWVGVAHAKWMSDGIKRHFGNHRKYESLKTTPDVVDTYVKWVGPSKLHSELLHNLEGDGATDPSSRFDALYRSMEAVNRFGRMARFDYLTMLGKLDLASIEPARAYLAGATGPVRGARLLIGNSTTAPIPVEKLEDTLVILGADLGVNQQVMEDSTCNWQKSPSVFIPFRG